MKPMMQNRYVGWMAVRPLVFGTEYFEPGDRVPQKLLETMRDPEVLVRTRRLAAVAKDMSKVPRYLRKDVTDAEEMLARILAPRIASQIGPVMPTAQLAQYEDLAGEPEAEDAQGTDEPQDQPAGQPDVPSGTELSVGDDGQFRTPDGQVYEGPVVEGQEPVITETDDAATIAQIAPVIEEPAVEDTEAVQPEPTEPETPETTQPEAPEGS